MVTVVGALGMGPALDAAAAALASRGAPRLSYYFEAYTEMAGKWKSINQNSHLPRTRTRISWFVAFVSSCFLLLGFLVSSTCTSHFSMARRALSFSLW